MNLPSKLLTFSILGASIFEAGKYFHQRLGPGYRVLTDAFGGGLASVPYVMGSLFAVLVFFTACALLIARFMFYPK